MELRDPNTGQIKTWVWGIAGVGFIVIIFVVMKAIGGQSTTGSTQVAAGQSSDITDAMSTMEQELQALLEQQSNATPPPSTNPPPDPHPHAHTMRDYVVKHNETWTSISTMFGMTLAQFFKHNPTLKGTDPNQMRGGGRTIKVFDNPPTLPPPTQKPVSYTTKFGDTWKSIAAKFNLTLPQFYALNPTIHHRPNVNRPKGVSVIVGTSNVH
jgi:LysM repeat protein